jgi:hypothetical protein
MNIPATGSQVILGGPPGLVPGQTSPISRDTKPADAADVALGGLSRPGPGLHQAICWTRPAGPHLNSAGERVISGLLASVIVSMPPTVATSAVCEVPRVDTNEV